MSTILKRNYILTLAIESYSMDYAFIKMGFIQGNELIGAKEFNDIVTRQALFDSKRKKNGIQKRVLQGFSIYTI